MTETERTALCPSVDLQEGGLAVPFDVQFAGQTCRGFAVRFEGEVHAYVNRCTHVGMELDWQPNQVFDASGAWLICASHGAAYAPDSGACVGGPCRKALQKIDCSEADNIVYWHSAWNLRPVVF